MKITDIHVDGFGVWNELSVDDLSGDVTLFFGRNEAGKTTLMQFVRAVLYGFSPERRKLYMPPVYGGEPGGMLRVENHSGQFVVERRLAERNENGSGRVVVLGANGSRQGQHLLNVMLSGVDESIFHNVFAVGIRELQELATLNDTEAAELLYNLSSGVDRVSLVEVMRDLERDRRGILAGDDQESQVTQLLAQRDKLVFEVTELESQTRRWADLSAERGTLVNEVRELEQRIVHFKREARTIEIAVQVRDKWQQRVEVQQAREKCGDVEPLPEGCVDRLDSINEQIAQYREELRPLKQRRLETRRELAAQPINLALWNESSRIAAICEHGPWIDSLDGEIRQLTQETESLELELLQHDESLSAEGGVTLVDAPVVTSRMIQQLQPPALAWREAIKRRSFARKAQKKSKQEEQQAVGELESELAGKNADNLDEALQKTGERVSQLRNRIKVEDRLDHMRRQQEDLEQEHHELLDTQFQRVRLLIGVGGMFVFGFVLLLSSLFGYRVMPITPEISWGVGFLGLICIGMSSAWKVLLERTGQEELGNCIRRRETLDRDIEESNNLRDELDRALPSGGGNFSSRLATAERELKELEAMAPLYNERVNARRRIQESRRQITGVDDDSREARARWRRALRQAGLPESLTPRHVRQLGAHHQKKSKIESRLVTRRERLDKLTVDRDELVNRLRQVHEDVGIRTVSEDPQIQLSQLAAALAGQREMIRQRKELQRQEREIRRQLATGVQHLRRLRRGREAVFAEARVTDEDELRARVERIVRRAELDTRWNALSEQIQTVLGKHYEEDEIEPVIQGHSLEGLNQRLRDVVTRLQDSQAHLGQIHQRQGEINQEMKSLSDNRRLGTARLELACVREQLVKATEKWRSLTMTWQLLESIRETYEAERQPETLDEASLYLERLTNGKYSRIWTPLARNELRVDDQAENSLSLDVLSRGTREAVFLSLRLALVASYGRRGINIPMVLDDVLVNLDAGRAAAAIETLCDFAKDGRQLLFFTCHEHIREMFERARVDIRVLPGHGTPGMRVARLEYEDPLAKEPAGQLEETGVLEEEVEVDEYEEETEALGEEQVADGEYDLEEVVDEELELEDVDEELVDEEFELEDEEEEFVDDEALEIVDENEIDFSDEEDVEEEVEEEEEVAAEDEEERMLQIDDGQLDDYTLQDAVDRVRWTTTVDLSQYELAEPKPQQPPAQPNRPKRAEISVEELIANVPTDEPWPSHEQVEQVEEVFAENDVAESLDGPWWEDAKNDRLSEEEAAA